MTRKRFTKLLMAQGYSRNEANLYATRARVLGHSYETAYYMINFKSVQIIGEAVRNAMQTISKIVNAVGAGVTACTTTGSRSENTMRCSPRGRRKRSALHARISAGDEEWAGFFRFSLKV